MSGFKRVDPKAPALPFKPFHPLSIASPSPGRKAFAALAAAGMYLSITGASALIAGDCSFPNFACYVFDLP
jgi:hypothetical protein